MIHRPRAALVLVAALAAGPAMADDYAAVSTTAMAITGDVSFDDFSIAFSNGEELVFDELLADTFIVDGETVGASVFSLTEAADPVLLNGNTLCGGGEPVTYLASWGAVDPTLTVIAFFSTRDAPSSDAEMCASYTYE